MTCGEARQTIDAIGQALVRDGHDVTWTPRRTTRAYTITMTVDGETIATGSGKTELLAWDSLASALQRRAA